MPAPPAGAALPAHPPVTAEYAAGSARSARIATLDWPDLRRAAADCRACGLCDTRRQAVFGSGSTQAHWLGVGEAPGADEDASGEPLVGAAGQLLDAMLRALGLSRAGGASDAGTEESAVAASDAADCEPLPPQRRAYIANTLKCRPPGNRNPAPEEMARCEPFLQRQIELLRPRLILAMGRFAAQSLLRSTEPLGKLRGRVHRYQGLPLVVTYHPAYLLRSPAEKAKAWEDLCLAAETMDAMDAMQVTPAAKVPDAPTTA